MHLIFDNNKTILDVLKEKPEKKFKLISGNYSNHKFNNLLIKGDNLNVMKFLLEDFNLKHKIDLVYIDIPFATNNVFRAGVSRTSTISSSRNDPIAYNDKLKGKDFLEFIRERLIILREFMSDCSSIYLHIDYKIGHYIKIIMDDVFGFDKFRNDITRIKCNPKNFKRNAYGNVKDLILFYTKTNNYVWNEPKIKMDGENIIKLFNKIDDKRRRYTTNPLHAPGETLNGKSGKKWRNLEPPKGRHWRYAPEVLDELDKKGLLEWSDNGVPRKIIYADDYGMKRLQDIWEFKDPQNPIYPTEKNLALLELIIKTSSNENQIVMDAFCGSGGTLYSAAKLNRNWIGIDKSDVAIDITKKRFSTSENTLYFNQYFEYCYLEETEY